MGKSGLPGTFAYIFFNISGRMLDNDKYIEIRIGRCVTTSARAEHPNIKRGNPLFHKLLQGASYGKIFFIHTLNDISNRSTLTMI